MELKFILESLLFSAQKPMSVKELRDVLANAATAEDAEEAAKPFNKTKDDDLTAALEELAREHEAAARSYRLACVAGAWQFVTQPEFSPWLKALVGVKARPSRLSQAALETLAIIAYRQPVTRAEVVGRPALYSTTPSFLEYFGLRGLEDLPAADELRRIPVERPPAPVTADAGLATVPPEQLQLDESVKIKNEEPPAPGPTETPS